MARLPHAQWKALDDLADTTGKSVAKLLREAVAEFTHVPDTAPTHRRAGWKAKT